MNKKNNDTAFVIKLPKQDVIVKNEDIDDIIESGMRGCTYWCDRVEPVGPYLGEYANEQISRNGLLRFYRKEEDIPARMGKDNFHNGLCRWFMLSMPDMSRVVNNGRIDAGEIDAYEADAILQYALFGEIAYS